MQESTQGGLSVALLFIDDVQEGLSLNVATEVIQKELQHPPPHVL